VSELTKEKGGNPLSRFKVDDVIQAKAININKDEKKIALSIKQLEESDEDNIYKKYLNNSMQTTSNFGELLKAGIMNLEKKDQSNKTKPEGDMEKDTNNDSPADEDTPVGTDKGEQEETKGEEEEETLDEHES